MESLAISWDIVLYIYIIIIVMPLKMLALS